LSGIVLLTTGTGSALGAAAAAAESSTAVDTATFSSIAVGEFDDDDEDSSVSTFAGTSAVVVVVGALRCISTNNFDEPLFTLVVRAEGAVNADVVEAATATLMTRAENFIVTSVCLESLLSDEMDFVSDVDNFVRLKGVVSLRKKSDG